MAKRSSKKVRKDALPVKVMRCDRLRLEPNAVKSIAMASMQRIWRGAACEIASDQWRRFFVGSGLDPLADVATDHRRAGTAIRSWILAAIAERHGLSDEPVPKDEDQDKKIRKVLPEMAPGLDDPFAATKAKVGAAQFQMVRGQVVGILRSFVSNRQNDFVDAVLGSSLWFKPKLGETATELDPVEEKRLDKKRHMLFAVNVAEAWFDLKREVRVSSEEGGYADEIVPQDVRLLARWIMRGVMRRHRRPSMRDIGMVVDKRVAEISVPEGAKGFRFWMTLTVAKNKKIHVPVVVHDRFLARKGVRSNVLQINRDAETGQWSVGVPTDQSELAKSTTKQYLASVQTETLSLDFGLATMFASDQGDLVGNGFLEKLRRLDDTIQGIARHVRRGGQKPRDSARYRKHVVRLRGYVRTEIGRVINRLIEVRRPGRIVLERLTFTSPMLSRRLNRIVSNCGRSVLKNKLAALREEKGITSLLVPCAYSSQTCSTCGYVDPKNRRSRSRFECRWCGLKIHADVNAARVLAERRSPATKGTDDRDGRKRTLADIVSMHGGRWPEERRKPLPGRTRGNGTPPDPRRTNPYFKGWSWCVEARLPDGANAEPKVAEVTQAVRASATAYATLPPGGRRA